MCASSLRGPKMEPFKPLHAMVVPLPVANVDTDQIVPARFLWRKRGDGWAGFLFHDLRFNEDGTLKPGFVLNRPDYQGARILVAERNFGCGSSREHAVWALFEWGIRAIVAPSFGDIFYNNCCQNGLLPIELAPEIVAALLETLNKKRGTELGVDLEAQTLEGPSGEKHPFEIDPFQKECLLAGTDKIGFTLRLQDEITKFENSYGESASWL